MRYSWLTVLFVFTVICPVWSQQDDCPGWKNPSSFSTAPNFYWSARVGERVYYNSQTDTTTGYYVMSTCADPNAQVITGHASITSTSLNSGDDFGIQCCNDGNLWDANGRRFQIITYENAGLDQFTINGGTGMQRICPGYTTSIRLGDPRATGNCAHTHSWSTGTNKGSEALFYTMQVTPMNALLFINYAVVGRCYSHGPHEAGEFLIRVVKQNDDGTWPNAPINDSLWFKVSAPAIPTSGPIPPWTMGRPGTTCGGTTCAYVYKPWTKVAISLSKYLYKNIRVEMYTSDCTYDVDPLYAYVCGDYQPMRINSAGCADAYSDAIDTLKAPEGLTQYTWYVATRGAEEDIYDATYMESVSFRQLTQPSESNLYTPTIADFVLTQGPNAGDTVSTQTFMCTMVSALDPNKPFMSKVYTNLENSKPKAETSFNTDCDGMVHLRDVSVTYGSDQIDPDSTYWVIYSDTTGQQVLDTVWGRNVDYQLPSDGFYKVAMRTMIFGKTCSSMKETVFQVWQPHEIPISLSDSVICEDDIVTAWAVGGEGFEKEWRIDDSLVYRSDALHPYDTVTFQPSAGNHVISLTTTSEGHCPATTTIGLKVIGNGTITSNVDASLICRGDSVTLSAMGIDLPRWVSTPFDSSLVGTEGQNVVVVKPQVTTSYTVVPMGDSRCIQNSSDITIMVLPYPIPTIYTSRPAVELTNPSLHIEDRSPNSTSSHWTFSDGQTDEGASINHYFGTSGDSVWIALHACNEDRCCADTSISLPVQVNALWIPNTFTPNREPNSRFTFFTTLEMTYYEIWIYNRQGMLVYHGTDINQPWDGVDLHGNACPQGAYVYHYVYSCTQDPERKHPGDGTVTLLR